MVNKKYVPFDDNINWSGQKRARDLKSKVKAIKKNKKFLKSAGVSKQDMKAVETKYKQFKHKECPKKKGKTQHYVPPHTRNHKSKGKIKVKGYCRKDKKQ